MFSKTSILKQPKSPFSPQIDNLTRDQNYDLDHLREALKKFQWEIHEETKEPKQESGGILPVQQEPVMAVEKMPLNDVLEELFDITIIHGKKISEERKDALLKRYHALTGRCSPRFF